MQIPFKVGDLITRIGHSTVTGVIIKLENGYAEVQFKHVIARSHQVRWTMAYLPVEQLERVLKPVVMSQPTPTTAGDGSAGPSPVAQAPRAARGPAKANEILGKVGAAIIGAALLLGAGCARMTQTLSTTLTYTNGTLEVRESKATGWAIWDAKQTLEKLRVSNGKTHSIGLTGADQETSSTNAAATLDALTRLLRTLQ